MRRELVEQMELTPDQNTLLDNHSILAKFNVLEHQLALLFERTSDSRLDEFLKFCIDILVELPTSGIQPLIPEVEQSYQQIEELLNDLSEDHEEHELLIRGIRETIEIGRTRLHEMKIDRNIWRETPVEEFRSNLSSFLKATELVSGFRFRFNLTQDATSDSSYHVKMEFDFPRERISAPVILGDVIRDLVANSRKYSNPGTCIHLQLRQLKNQGLSLKVADEGKGIPEDEISKVVHYGYRATNVMDRRTMGGGLGLTKAYQFCKQSRGRFFIESELNKGTKIELSLYPPH